MPRAGNYLYKAALALSYLCPAPASLPCTWKVQGLPHLESWKACKFREWTKLVPDFWDNEVLLKLHRRVRHMLISPNNSYSKQQTQLLCGTFLSLPWGSSKISLVFSLGTCVSDPRYVTQSVLTDSKSFCFYIQLCENIDTSFGEKCHTTTF